MIDPKDAVHAFKAKFDTMTYDEREHYLKSMGFSFVADNETEKKSISHSSRYGVVTKKQPTQNTGELCKNEG